MGKIAKILKEDRAIAACIPIYKELYSSGSYMERGNWFAKSIINLTSQVPNLSIEVLKNEGATWVGEIIDRVKHICGCSNGGKRNVMSDGMCQ